MLCSFIIPAYNASTTIVRCLNSIYALPFNMADFEVIIINDCSKDNTIEMVEDYAKQHTNITLICQTENHRQGAARNRGVSIAKGKYIVYVDSDDESDKGVLQALQLAEENELDMVAMHYVIVDKSGNITEKEQISLDSMFTGIELQTKHPYWCAGPIAYLYRKSFLEKVNYPFESNVLFEDSDYVTVHLYHAERMMYSTRCAYCVHYNNTSTTHTTTYKHVADHVLLGTRMLNFYCSLNDRNSTYAKGILEGGSYNIWISCKRLLKLSSIKDVKAFYNRIDSFINRAALLGYNKPSYCWTSWTKLCLRHKYIAILFISVGQLGYKLNKKLRNR